MEYQVSSIEYQVSSIKYQVSSITIKYRVSSIKYYILSIKHMIIRWLYNIRLFFPFNWILIIQHITLLNINVTHLNSIYPTWTAYNPPEQHITHLNFSSTMEIELRHTLDSWNLACSLNSQKKVMQGGLNCLVGLVGLVSLVFLSHIAIFGGNDIT